MTTRTMPDTLLCLMGNDHLSSCGPFVVYRSGIPFIQEGALVWKNSFTSAGVSIDNQNVIRIKRDEVWAFQNPESPTEALNLDIDGEASCSPS